MVNKRTSIYKNCEVCSAEFYTYSYRIVDGRGRFCSKVCQYKTYKGIRRSPFSEFKKGENTGANHRLWKGEKVGYHALHAWVNRKLGKPKKCSRCGFTSINGRQFHWTNINGKYRRDLNEWERLCVSCHRREDSRAPKIPISRFSYEDIMS